MTKEAQTRLAELVDFFGLLIERFKRTDAVFANRLEVSERELALLHALAREGPMITKRLAARFDVPLSTMTGLVDRMEKKGLVRRVPHRHDRRSIELEATPAGTLVLGEHARMIETMARAMLDALPDRDQKALIAILRRVQAHFAAEAAKRSA